MIGERLAELRKLNGETQEDLAKAFHVSVPTVRTWERDKASPSHEVLLPLQQCAACHLQALRHLRRLPAGSDRHRPLGRGSQTAPAPDRRRTERDAPLRRISVVETQKISRPARP